MKNIPIVLGAPNAPSGELSNIAKSRLDRCVELYKPGTPVLCTGGWGSHFNMAPEAHAVYAQRYLVENGIREDDLLEPALSQNTVDDAVKVKEILDRGNYLRLTVITSDYHLERVRLIFGQILHDFGIEYEGPATAMEKEELETRLAHERQAVAAIRKNGLYY